MARGTIFGAMHSNIDLGLIQQKIEISPAEPKLNLVDIPCADGSKDMTESLGVGVKYNDREITWTFALYPGADWFEKQAEISNALNGKRLHITPDGMDGWYYDGRISVDNYTSDRLLHQITVKAICFPYKRKTSDTVATREDLSTIYKNLSLHIGPMPQIPVITVAQDTTIKWGDVVVTLNAGTITIPDLYMSGDQTLQAKVTSGTGQIIITWREGSL